MNDSNAPGAATGAPAARWPEWSLQVAGAVGSGVLLAAFALLESGWPLGFVLLVPWWLALSRARSLAGTLGSAWLMSIAYVLGALHWFAWALGAYVGVDAWLSLLVLVLAAPLLQPQLIAFALVRFWMARRRGDALAVIAAAAAWIACEWLWPKVLGDTLGHGLQPSPWLRQAADLGGAAALTLMLLLVNAAIVHALGGWRPGSPRRWRPLAWAALLTLLWLGYGGWRLAEVGRHSAEPTASLRVGLVQANMTDLEARRAEQGAYAVVRSLLDTHFALSLHAVRDQGADAVVWSETVYPTTFGTPKSGDGAELDAEILDFSRALGVPLAFGTYDRDAVGEYNAAAFVDPARGLLGHYRKTHPFPLTERVPAWADHAWLRRALPWTGSWLAGDGARVFPLRATDGREVNVVPLICLDDVHPQLAIDGARLGAEAIVGMSNDAWFSAWPAGARLHLAVASFRSIETRLPQLRVTTNGLSALIDETGEIVVRTGIDQQAVLVGEIPLRAPLATLMVRWGDWLGAAACALLLLLLGALWQGRRGVRSEADLSAAAASRPLRLAVMTPLGSAVAAASRLVAGAVLAWLAWRMHSTDGWQVNAMVQIQAFVFGVLIPLVLAWAIGRVSLAQVGIEPGHLVLSQRGRRFEVPLASVRSMGLRHWCTRGACVQLDLASGRVWSRALGVDDPLRLQQLLGAQGDGAPPWRDTAAQRRAVRASERARAKHPWLDRGWLKFGVFPLLLALPAFRLHQHIAFGATFGELHTFGLAAWLGGLVLWWVSWALGLMLLAAALRLGIEAAMGARDVLAGIGGGPDSGPARTGLRQALERLGRWLYFAGVPGWLAYRLLAA